MWQRHLSFTMWETPCPLHRDMATTPRLSSREPPRARVKNLPSNWAPRDSDWYWWTRRAKSHSLQSWVRDMKAVKLSPLTSQARPRGKTMMSCARAFRTLQMAKVIRGLARSPFLSMALRDLMLARAKSTSRPIRSSLRQRMLMCSLSWWWHDSWGLRCWLEERTRVQLSTWRLTMRTGQPSMLLYIRPAKLPRLTHLTSLVLSTRTRWISWPWKECLLSQKETHMECQLLSW